MLAINSLSLSELKVFGIVAHQGDAGLDEAQAGIEIAGRNTNNLRYVEDITLMAENEEELKNLLMRVKEKSEKASLKLNIKKQTGAYYTE